jgi:hypothetical protein
MLHRRLRKPRTLSPITCLASGYRLTPHLLPSLSATCHCLAPHLDLRTWIFGERRAGGTLGGGFVTRCNIIAAAESDGQNKARFSKLCPAKYAIAAATEKQSTNIFL